MSAVGQEWKSRYNVLVPVFLKNPPDWLEDYPFFIGEDVRLYMLRNGVGNPPHPNDWGAQFKEKFLRSGYLMRTGKTRNAKGAKSNGHAFRLWISTLAEVPDRMETLNVELVALGNRVRTRDLSLQQALLLAAGLGAEMVI